MSRARRQAYFRASSSPSPSSSPPAGRRTRTGLKGLLFMTGVTSTFHPSSKWCKDCLVCDIYVAQPRVQAVPGLSAPWQLLLVCLLSFSAWKKLINFYTREHEMLLEVDQN